MDWDNDKEFKPFDEILDYDNKQLLEEILPLFDTILSVFTENYWLAFSSTKDHYSDVLNYIEVCKRQTISSPPKDVLAQLQHTQRKIEPFFLNVVQCLAKLEKYLSRDISYRKLES